MRMARAGRRLPRRSSGSAGYSERRLAFPYRHCRRLRKLDGSFRALGSGIGLFRVRSLDRWAVAFARNRHRRPDWPFGRVAPGARPIESMHTKPVHLLHLVHPTRVDPVGVVVRGVAHFAEPDFAVEHVAGDGLWLLPHVELVDFAQILALTGEGELTAQMPMGVLIDHAADIVWIVAGE